MSFVFVTAASATRIVLHPPSADRQRARASQLRAEAEGLESKARRATAERAAPPTNGGGGRAVHTSAGVVERVPLKGYWFTPSQDTTNPGTGKRIRAGQRVWVPSINPPRANDDLYRRARQLRAEADRLEEQRQ